MMILTAASRSVSRNLLRAMARRASSRLRAVCASFSAPLSDRRVRFAGGCSSLTKLFHCNFRLTGKKQCVRNREPKERQDSPRDSKPSKAIFFVQTVYTYSLKFSRIVAHGNRRLLTEPLAWQRLIFKLKGRLCNVVVQTVYSEQFTDGTIAIDRLALFNAHNRHSRGRREEGLIK